MTREEAAHKLGDLALRLPNEVYDRYAEPLAMAIKALEEEPRSTAHWEEVRDMLGDSLWRCSHCGIEWTFIEGTPEDNGTKYCPNCGAEMETEK